MLFCRVLASSHFWIPSRLSPALLGCPSNSHGIISFADPHPLTLLQSYRFKNIGGTLYPPTGANALLSAEQIRRLDASEANKHYHQHEQIQRCAHGSAQSRVASVRLCDVRVRDGRAVWARRHGDDERAGANAAVSPVIPFFWCIPVSLV